MSVDYRNFKGLAGGERKDSDVSRQTQRWWKLEGKSQADQISDVLNFLRDNQGLRLAQLIMSGRLYGNMSMLGSGLSFARVAQVHPTIRDRISYNLIQSCVDAITSKISKNKPKPYFLTNGGDYKLQRRAKKLNQFVEGLFWENQAYRLGSQVFRDAAVWGDGLIHVYNGNGRVRWERVLCSEMYVDEIEGIYGSPRSLHRVKNVDRDVLLSLDGLDNSAKKLIRNANKNVTDEVNGKGSISDVIQVRESWHLPSGEGRSDGERVISIAEGTLGGAKWTHDEFPFARISWSRRLYGFWGQGLAEQLQNLQLEINKLLWVIQRSMQLGGSFKLLLHTTAKVVTEHLNNDIGAVVKWSGQVEPKYVVPPLVPPEIYQHLMTLISRGFEQSGISQLTAASQKPDGLDSGKALREFNDIESDRFMTVGQAYENLFLDAARISIFTTKDIAEESGGYEVKAPGSKFLQTIDWKDVDLEDDEYLMQCYPVSSLPNEPAGRYSTLQEFAQGGIIEHDEIRPLMNLPDLERSDSLALAQREVIEKNLEAIVDGEDFQPPQSFDDLQLAMKLASQYYAQGRVQNLEEERLEKLRRYMLQVNALVQQATPPAPMLPPGAPPGAAPLGAPAPPPVSPLLPNAPGGQA